ncbi:hypothetical protein SDC9_89271 [bioreactor metagenome]|uniref:Sialidase domain-containing protein n=1 Tax=bioreactor metagenome TaxID=1076179 RepID=A0A644ZNX3_9ZZZZ|nr:hypothetical protein [Romboutsia lituseburensis]
MSFSNNSSTIIRRSNKDIFSIYCNDKDQRLICNCFDKDYNFYNSITILNKFIDFTNYSVSLGTDDTIYGVYKDNGIKYFEISNDNTLSFNEIFTFNDEKFDLLFPYIKKVDNNLHLFYYVFNNEAPGTCALFHHHNKNNIWTENKIDFLTHSILNNYCISWVNNSPIVFYLNIVDGYEEVFLSRFNCNSLTWSTPLQITHSKKNKVYLSVLKDAMNFYHLTFCENEDNAYSVKYINGYLMDDGLDIRNAKSISIPCACMYPNLIKHKSNIYLMWVEYNRLKTCSSSDLGSSWTNQTIDEFSIEEDFIKANFLSNYKEDLLYNSTSVFTTSNDIALLGF